jgi:hypothetical protein
MRRALPYFFLMASVSMACGSAFTEDDSTDSGSDGSSSTSDSSGDDDAPDDQTLITPEAGPNQDGGDAAPTDAAEDATTQGVDATLPDASPDVSPPMDAMAAMDTSTPVDTGPPPTDACTGEIADEATGVFVVPGGATSNCGSRATPCGSVQTAVTSASQNGLANVYLSVGTYTEQVTLASNVAIQGGWDTSGSVWTRDCGSGNNVDAIIQAPTNENITIVANGVTGATLDTVTISSKAESAVGVGESVYGIMATNGSTLALINVSVSVVGAGAGAGGSIGTGASGVVACTTAGNPPMAQGAPGSPGLAGGAGGYSSTGYTAGGVGGMGGTASPGNNGSAGVAAAPAVCEEPTYGTCPPQDPSCTPPCTISDKSFPVTAGSFGCGGNGGGGGSGGAGGGSSIALYVWGATATATGGSLAAGVGGNGGPAGGGGTGAMGSAGVASTSACTSESCNGVAGNSVQHVGTAGSVGGTGGTGGAGGGGAGGDSYAWYAGGGGSVSTSNTALSHGTGGQGGSGGNAGPAGTGAPHN